MGIKWYTKNDIINSVDVFIEKCINNKEINETKDADLFFKAIIETLHICKGDWGELEDDMEEIDDFIKDFGTVTYYINIENTNQKFILQLKKNIYKLGLFNGEFKELNNNITQTSIKWNPDDFKKILLNFSQSTKNGKWVSPQFSDIQGEVEIANNFDQFILLLSEFIGLYDDYSDWIEEMDE